MTKRVFLGLAATLGLMASTADAAPMRRSPLADIGAYACGAVPQDVRFGVDGSNVGRRAVRGRPEAIGEQRDPMFPWITKLNIVLNEDPATGYMESDNCGGAIIDSRWILTAAHCVAGGGWSRIEITAGSANLQSGVVRREAHVAVCNAAYDRTMLANDVALIRLEEPLPQELVNTAARLPAQGQELIGRGDLAHAAGWRVSGPVDPEHTLRKAEVKVDAIEPGGFITVSSAFGQLRGICRGESGGPLLTRKNGTAYQVGVFSGVDPGGRDPMTGQQLEECSSPGYNMYFTPVAPYRGWIDAVRGFCDQNPEACRTKMNYQAASERVYWRP